MTRLPTRLALVLIAAALAFAPPLASQPRAQAPASADVSTLQRDVLAALTGHADIRPGIHLVDRASLENRQEARTYLAAALTRLGLEPKRHDYSPTGENIYAVLPAAQPNAETVVLGAHYDTVPGAPGANDDGSGVAAVLGVAAEMSHVTPRSRDILFVFFDEEERGLVGSKAFAQKLKDENVNVHSVHTIDQLAWDSNGNRAVEIELPYERAMELYQAASDRLTPPIPLLATSETGSDHQAFRRLGFKAVGVTEEYRHHDTTPYYHKPGDTFDTVNFDYLASGTRLVVEVMKALTK
jgi:hypothetical protein